MIVLPKTKYIGKTTQKDDISTISTKIENTAQTQVHARTKKIDCE
jgi:hypothetical protein